MILVFVQQTRKNSLLTQPQIRKIFAGLLFMGSLAACADPVSHSKDKETQQQVKKLADKKYKKLKPYTEKLIRSLVKQNNKIKTHARVRPQTRKKISELIGLTSDKVIAFLGPPNFIRRDAPSEFWRYQNHSCKLVIFLVDSKNKHKVTFAAICPIRKTSKLDGLNCFELTN